MQRHRILQMAALGVVLAGCQSNEPATPTAHMSVQHASGSAPSADVLAQLASLRRLTAPFQRFEAAQRAGWGTRITDCFSSVAGGMGFHYGNTALIDGSVDAQQPELLLYEPQPNGELRLVAVEYIVPFTAWTAAEPPRLYEQSFHRNEAFGLWVLHVWQFRENPSGIFADWNPRVSCAYADRVE